MKVIKPVGARVFVEDLEPEVSLVKRGAAVGLSIVVLDENAPKPTTGRVVAVGDDPVIQAMCKIGDVVCFKWSAGVYQQVQGKQYRCLEYREIISCITEQEAPEEQALPQLDDRTSEPSSDPKS